MEPEAPPPPPTSGLPAPQPLQESADGVADTQAAPEALSADYYALQQQQQQQHYQYWHAEAPPHSAPQSCRQLLLISGRTNAEEI